MCWYYNMQHIIKYVYNDIIMFINYKINKIFIISEYVENVY